MSVVAVIFPPTGERTRLEIEFREPEPKVEDEPEVLRIEASDA